MLEDAVVQPLELGRNSPSWAGGLVPFPDMPEVIRHRRGGRVVDFERADRGWKPRGAKDDSLSSKPMETLSGTYIYGGVLSSRHFGHFMAECVHRLLPAFAEWGRLPVVFAGYTHLLKPEDYFSGIAGEVLHWLGLDRQNVRVLSSRTLVKHLLVQPQASQLGVAPSEEYLNLLGNYVANHPVAGPSLSPSERIFVTRTGLDKSGGVLGEAYLAHIAESEGYRLIQPEQLSFREQMSVYLEARTAIFSEGSAIHGVELLGPNLFEQTLVMLRRRGGSTFERVLRPRSTSYLQTNPTSSTFCTSSIELGRKRVWAMSVSALPADQLLNLMRDNHLACFPNFDVNEYVKAMKLDFLRYLEWCSTQSEVVVDEALEFARLLYSSCGLRPPPDLKTSVAAACTAGIENAVYPRPLPEDALLIRDIAEQIAQGMPLGSDDAIKLLEVAARLRPKAPLIMQSLQRWSQTPGQLSREDRDFPE